MKSSEETLLKVAEIIEETAKLEMECGYSLLDLSAEVRSIPSGTVKPEVASALLQTLMEQRAQVAHRLAIHQSFTDSLRQMSGSQPDARPH